MIYFLLVIQQLIASSTHLVAKNITATVHPTTVVLLRGIFTCLAFGIWVLIRRRHLKKIERKDLLLIGVLGLINMCVNQLAFVWGVKYTTAPNAALAYALTPAFVVLILLMLRGEKPSLIKYLGLALAILGAAIVLVDRGASLNIDQMLGNFMVLSASISWAAFTVFGRPLIARYGPLHATALTFFAGLAFYIPLWLVMPVHDTTTALTDSTWASTWFQLFYLGVITSGVGYALWYVALSKLDPSRVAVFNNLQPVITSILAFMIFGTEPTVFFIVGGFIALSGVILTQRPA